MPTLMSMMLLEFSDSWILQETGQRNMRNRSGYGVTGCKTRFMFLSASKNCHKHLNNSGVSAKTPFPEGSTASDFRPRRFARWQCISSSWPSPLPCWAPCISPSTTATWEAAPMRLIWSNLECQGNCFWLVKVCLGCGVSIWWNKGSFSRWGAQRVLNTAFGLLD